MRWTTPLPLLRAPFQVTENYRPGGFIGDGEICNKCIEVNDAFSGKSRPGTANGFCVRVSYSKVARKGFAGTYWTWPDHN